MSLRFSRCIWTVYSVTPTVTEFNILTVVSCKINLIYWIITTVGKHVASIDALSCGNVAVRIDETPHLSIVIARLEVVQLCLRVVDVSSIPERIQSADGAGLGAGEGGRIAP